MSEEMDQEQEIDLGQLIADIQLDRRRIADSHMDQLTKTEIAGTVLSYIEDFAKIIFEQQAVLEELQESIDSSEPGGTVSPEFAAMVIDLAGSAELLANERLQIARMIHGVATLQEAKSKIGPPEQAETMLSRVVELSKQVLIELASYAEPAEDSADEEESEEESGGDESEEPQEA